MKTQIKFKTAILVGALFSTTSLFGQIDPNLQVTYVTTEVNCFGTNDGSINVNITGGVQPYTYVWNNAGVQGLNPSGLSIGAYILSVTDANGTLVEKSIGITGPTAPLTITLNSTNISAYGLSNGAIDAEISGGSPFKSVLEPYIFSWSNNSITLDQNNLSAGTYALTATDRNGCQATKSKILFKTNGFQNNRPTRSAENTEPIGIVYPNPSTGNVNVELNDDNVDEISIYSLRTGLSVQTISKNETIPTLESGEYILYFKTSGEVIGFEKFSVIN